ncbi:hypothetical protein V8G54_021894 [Vigna mungo]|uniref:Uncharacterized protein n=1 Tax=Vigna mungo TaxID=3915 RepID=A0AAQ3NGZ3_VIGMU
MVSLNAVQIWSTLWIFVGFVFNYIIQGLSVLGILCGFTVPAALIIDMIALATLHVSTLHWFISLVYSSQIQALAALWRLFRISMRGTLLPSPTPWTSMPYKEYWRLCHDSLIACYR